MTLSRISLLRPTNLLKLDRSVPTDRAYFPSTITSATLKSMILNHGPCRPSGPFQEYGDTGGGRPFSVTNTRLLLFLHWQSKRVVLLIKSKETILPHLLDVCRQENPDFQ